MSQEFTEICPHCECEECECEPEEDSYDYRLWIAERNRAERENFNDD